MRLVLRDKYHDICFCGLDIHYDLGLGMWLHTRARARFCQDGETAAPKEG